jgi:dGTPase
MPGRAPYAVADAEARREHPEPPHPYRGPYQRDRDRILHCSAFRRLDFKTQVFVPHEHDHFRTRLTHTLEVAQVARTLGRALGLNEDCIEAVALAHDLGHPPFGHGGEKELDELMVDHGHFEHNRQSLRVVDYLEHPYPEFRGLNLTQATRECIARHETRYDAPVCEEFDDDRLAPLEGQLVDLADEIAYSSADLEDALAARRIDEADLSDIELSRGSRQGGPRPARGTSTCASARPRACWRCWPTTWSRRRGPRWPRRNRPVWTTCAAIRPSSSA